MTSKELRAVKTTSQIADEVVRFMETTFDSDLKRSEFYDAQFQLVKTLDENRGELTAEQSERLDKVLARECRGMAWYRRWLKTGKTVLGFLDSVEVE